MAVSGKGKGKGKVDESDEGRKVVRDKGKKAILDKGKNVVRDDDEEEEYGSEEYVVDEAEEDESQYSSGKDIRVRRMKRHKRYKENFELDKEDYDLLEDANVTGIRRPANLGGKFKRLRKAGHVPSGNNSGTLPKEISEEEESEEEDEEEMVDDSSEEVGGYELLSKSQKKGGRQAQQISRRSRRGVQKIDRSYKPPLEGRKWLDREALAALNEEGVDSDDNDGNDQETLSRRLLEKQFEPSLLEVNYITARDDRLRQSDIPERIQIFYVVGFILFTLELLLSLWVLKEVYDYFRGSGKAAELKREAAAGAFRAPI